jgi:hypothetical protein
MLADVIDPLSGGAGWIGAGLLGAVLTWLFFMHLPSKDKQLRELTEAKDKQIEGLIASKDKATDVLLVQFRAAHDKAIDSFNRNMEVLQTTFGQRNDKALDSFTQMMREERETCQRWHEENRALLAKVLDETKENRHYISNLANQLGLRDAVEKAVRDEKPQA